MDTDDMDDLVMEPIDSSRTKSTPYLNHLIPMKKTTMVFQTPVQNKKISYDDILASMNLYVKDGKLHKIDPRNGIKMTRPEPKPKPPTQEEILQQQQQRRHALHLNYLQQQRLRAQIAETKTKRIKFINETESSHFDIDSHTTMQFFKLIGK